MSFVCRSQDALQAALSAAEAEKVGSPCGSAAATDSHRLLSWGGGKLRACPRSRAPVLAPAPEVAADGRSPPPPRLPSPRTQHLNIYNAI